MIAKERGAARKQRRHGVPSASAAVGAEAGAVVRVRRVESRPRQLAAGERIAVSCGGRPQHADAIALLGMIALTR